MFDPRRATLRYRLDKGECLGVLWLALGSVALCEAAARARPDAIVIDLQHGLWDRPTLEAAIGVIPAQIPVLARVAANTPECIAAGLDAGAEGVVIPLVETAKQARAAVKASRYPPLGERSGGGARPLADFVDYVDSANRNIVVVVMIETKKGLKNARAIAAVEGVDMVFIGTGDLALSLGTFPEFNARHEAACAQILEACRAEWTLCGCFSGNAEAARRRRAQGYRMVVTANDIEMASRAFNQATADFGRAAPDAPAVTAAPTTSLPVTRT